MTRLRQIIINLVGNAIKFTAQGEVLLSVTSRPLPTAPLYELHFSVRDTGIGIPRERMDRLFRLFSQVDVSTARRYGGTGLGLAISKQLTALMGGTMWVESEVGKGTTFHFTIQAEAASVSLPASPPDDYISKPVQIEKLAQALLRCQPSLPAPTRPLAPASPPRREPQLWGRGPIANAGAAIDLSVLEENMGISKEEAPQIIAELVPLFLDDASLILAELRQAVKPENAKRIRRAAHTLKGNSATFGATTLSHLCREQEEMYKRVVEKAAQIEEEYERVRAALESATQMGMRV